MELTNRLKRKYSRACTIENKSDSNSFQNDTEITKATNEDFEKIIKEMKNSDAVGIDGIQLKHIKGSVQNCSIMMTYLVNCIIKTNKWPTKMKIQVIRPIYKNGVKNNMDNYRPISILPVLNKLTEKFFANQLQDFLQINKIISEEQFGFQRGKGTVDALMKLNEEVSKALDEKKKVGLIFIDLQKAFDTVCRKKLIDKLRHYGLSRQFCGLLKSYLTDRFSCCRVEQLYSPFIKSDMGVPQGSILGPILFLIYMNDINKDNVLNLILFADDIVCVVTETNEDTLVLKIQQNLNAIQHWCLKNDLFISESKTKIMILTPKEPAFTFVLHEEKCSSTQRYTICSKIEAVSSAVYLGMVLDAK